MTLTTSKGRLAGRHVLITGGGGGIGLAIARACIAQGARCSVVDRAVEASAAAHALMQAHPDTLAYIAADVTDRAAIDRMLADAVARFGNAAIRDTNQRVAMDGFSKIPGFIAPTVRERLAKCDTIDSVAMLPALFLAFLRRWHRGELPYTYQDQGMDPAAAHAICEASDPVAAFCADTTLWGDLAGSARLVDAVRNAGARVDAFVAESVDKG